MSIHHHWVPMQSEKVSDRVYSCQWSQDLQVKTSKEHRCIFDTSATMEAQVVKTAQTAWYHLYSISKIRPYLTTEQTRCVIHAYATSRLDKNNSLLYGVPETTLLCKLQKVQNSAAKLILGGRKRDHATPFLQELHWLPVCQRHIFKTVFCWYTKHCKETVLRICRICWSPTRVTEMEWGQQVTSLVLMSPLLNTKLLVIVPSAWPQNVEYVT